MRNSAHVLAPIIIPRAVAVWGWTRLLFAALPMAVGEPFGSMSPPPIAIVLFACIVGLIDVHVRRERLLWANLSVKPVTLCAWYAAAAIPAECLLVVALR